MFSWLSCFFADAAYNAAIYSVDIASRAGMCQPKEPEALQVLAEEYRKSKENACKQIKKYKARHKKKTDRA